eukprot:5790654-Amphidinium_carterae.1
MQAAIQRICSLGQQLETLQATAGAATPHLTPTGGDVIGAKPQEQAPQPGRHAGTEGKDAPGAKSSGDMEVETTLPAETVPPSAQPPGTG